MTSHSDPTSLPGPPLCPQLPWPSDSLFPSLVPLLLLFPLPGILFPQGFTGLSPPCSVLGSNVTYFPDH